IQAATNGVRFALEPEFAYQAREAGLNLVYFQLDGVTNEANKHRHIPNLFDVKLQAMENLAAADIWITPVTTVVNGLNTDQIGPLMQFIIDNCDKMDAISFQPISFTGRDEEVTDEQRHAQRYTTAHLAWELHRWSRGEIDPYRDWYPLGAGAPLTMLADHVGDPADKFGGMCVSCHPDCGSCVYIVANKKTKVWAPFTKFFNLEQFIKDVMVITDSARGKRSTMAQVALSLARNFDERQSPDGFDLSELVRLIQHQFHGSITDGQRPPQKDWTLIWAGGMWFQDLWTYDFRRTEMCCVPYGTQEGEISFCAYNTGMGWRQIIESKHRNAKTADWYREKGRHRIYSGDRPIQLNVHAPSIRVPAVKSGGYCAMCMEKSVASSGVPGGGAAVAPPAEKKEPEPVGV
ncbi:MAG: radical SAM protein, partial [Bacteroidetes bacterium]|nr:radical SAM protein [Bacteroidota bacterium]